MYNKSMDKKIAEWKRVRAWELKQEGWKQNDIAKTLKVTKSAVSQWMKRGREGGVEALKTKPPRQYKRKLTDEQIRQLIEDLKKGAEAFGYKGNVWTGKRISDLIMREFGVFYHWHSIARLMRQIGWSSQKPIQRANQRNEKAIN
ncbi:MAG: winged helix-turn-helix domain-containing protein, partial [Athalassotoga sp.]|uniref:winged helix-turn-helix domain-containing protein n=1 Tax=Athalassotoga sp. TaxID=2022597 RepID=UPI003D087198